jgi:hypothetical protein
MKISCDLRREPRFTGMNARIFALSASLLAAACAGDSTMTRHDVCERLAAASCARLAVCEPTVAQTGCVAASMDRCCPDGVCDEAVVADEDRLSACEGAVEQMSCSDLDDGDLPASCDHLTDPVPQELDPGDGAGSGSGDGDGSGSGSDASGVLEVRWYISAGGSTPSCAAFGAQTVHVVATSASGDKVTTDFDCALGSGLATLPAGPYSIVAQAVGAGGAVVQQTPAETVVVDGGASVTFTFNVTTSVGGFCVQLASALCGACDPESGTCEQDVVDACCASDGVCNDPALVSSTWSTCLSQSASGSYCSALPASCSNAITIF